MSWVYVQREKPLKLSWSNCLPTQFSPQGQINLFQNKYLPKKNKLQSNDDFLHSYNKQKLHAEDELHHWKKHLLLTSHVSKTYHTLNTSGPQKPFELQLLIDEQIKQSPQDVLSSVVAKSKTYTHAHKKHMQIWWQKWVHSMQWKTYDHSSHTC